MGCLTDPLHNIINTFFFEVFTVERVEASAVDPRTDGESSHVSDFVVHQIVVEVLAYFCAVEVVGRNGEVGREEEVFYFWGG